MGEGKYQKELFEFDNRKRAFPKFDKMIPKGDFAIILNLEKTVFVSIGIIMLLVVIYALGVERGKTVSRKIARPAAAPVRQPIPVKQQAVAAPVITPAPVALVTKPAPAVVAADPSKPYTIVAATFTRKEWADQEAERLKRSGFEAFATPSEPYFIVCIGAFVNKDAAKPVLNKVRRSYKDAYTRLR
ncbi:MAG: SPOR domain-containing protein [Candidatus Omnitrophota bacterium]|jgi:cell division septation protein DedD